ncbi:UDP-Gal or UDP-GlcNAc-dependent glycosyltransferase, partial [Trypanosoma theileri]
EQFVSYTPLQRLVYTPYSKEEEAKFLSLYMHHEDMMVGYVLHKILRINITFVKEKRCRFHDLHRGHHRRRVTWSSVVMHRADESDYKKLLKRFQKYTNPPAKAYNVRFGRLEFEC